MMEDSIYTAPVICSKISGHLHIRNTSVFWQQENGTKQLTIPYTIIAKQQLSARTSEHVILKILTKENKAYGFVFTSENKLEERDTCKEFISSLLKQDAISEVSKRGISNSFVNDDYVMNVEGSDRYAKEKALFKDNFELKELYDTMVLSGIISEEEFWTSRKGLLDREGRGDSINSQKGISSNSISEASDIIPDVIQGESFQFNLTPEKIHKIFVDSPSVLQSYQAQVPHKLSEKEFWTKYFKSNWILKSKKTNTETTSLSMKDNSKSTTIKTNLNYINPTNNLTVEEESDDETEQKFTGSARDHKNDPKRMAYRELCHKFNRHADLLLKSFLGEDIEKDAQPGIQDIIDLRDDDKAFTVNNGDTFVPSKKRKLDNSPQKYYQERVQTKEEPPKEEHHFVLQYHQDHIDQKTQKKRDSYKSVYQIEDLIGVTDESDTHSELVLKNYRDYYAEMDNESSEIEQDCTDEILNIKQQICNWSPSPLDIPHHIRTKINSELYPIKFKNKKNEESGVEHVLRMHHLTCNELLRHFWTNYGNLRKGKGLLEKNEKLAQSLQDLLKKMDSTVSDILSTTGNPELVGILQPNYKAIELALAAASNYQKF